MMRIAFAVALAAAVAPAVVESYVPQTSSIRSSRGLFRSGTSRLSSTTALRAASSFPNPLKSLPWNAAREREREARRLKVESAKLHRELGIAEDATFEEIVEATDALMARAGDDAKKRIKIEVAKDRIMQIRLNERLAGLTKLTSEAAAQSAAEAGNYQDDMDDIKESKKAGELLDDPPGFLGDIIKKPDDAWRQKQVKQWGLLTAVCLVLPPLAAQIGYLNWIIAGAQIMNRGVPEGDRFEMEERGAKKSKTKSFLIALGIWFATKVLFGFLSEIFPSLLVNKMAVAMETVWLNFNLATATLYIQTYKE